MKTTSVCKFTLVALPLSFFVMLCGLTLSNWPLFVYDTSLKPSFQILTLPKVLWPAILGLLITVGIEISIWKTLTQVKNTGRRLEGIFFSGSTFTAAGVLGLYILLGLAISYYIFYHWHDMFMYYTIHFQGDITFIAGLSIFVTSLSFFIITCNIYNSKLLLKESAPKF